VLCPAVLQCDGDAARLQAHVIELSLGGFQLRAKAELAPGTQGQAQVSLGETEDSELRFEVVRRISFDGEHHFMGCRLVEPDTVWRRCVAALESGVTAADVHAY
jgi:hypothetical protein